jgi:hypothetical protein
VKRRKPFTGDERIVKRLAWYPIKVQGTLYWFKRIKIKQSYNTRHDGWNNDWIVEQEEDSGLSDF